MANLTSQNIAVAKLYTALFNRAPDASGFAFWLQAVNNGFSLTTLAQTFLGSPEALLIYPASQTNAQFVTAFYSSVFGRAPDADGLAFWSAALQANGGAGSATARAALVAQITDIVSTPLAAKPAGMSDAAYAQTVADRAMFGNKIEFGVYFATELKSNDLALAKATLALVTDSPTSLLAATNLATNPAAPVPAEPTLNLTAADTPSQIISKLAAYAGTAATVNATSMTALQLAEVAVGISKIAASGIGGDLILSNAQSDVQLTTLLGAKTADVANVQVNASGMATAKLIALSEGIGKVDGIASLSLTLADINGVGNQAAAAGNLLSKAVGAMVVATGSTAAQISALGTYIANVATDGITGNVALTNDLTAAQFGNLLGTKMTAAANVVVDATGLVDGAKLGALVDGIAKVDTLNNLSLDLNLAADSVSVALLDKGSAGMRASTTGASTVEIAKVVDKISLFADGGLSGALTLTPAQLLAATPSTLNAKLAGGAALSVVGDATNEIINLSGLTQGVTVSGGAGADTITLGGGSDTLILGPQSDTRSALIVGTDTTTAKIDKIMSFNTADKIQLSTAQDAYGAGLKFSSATVLAASIEDDTYIPTLQLTNATPANFTALFAALNARTLDLIIPTASTDALAQVVYINFTTASSGLAGAYLVINDKNSVFDANDTIISLPVPAGLNALKDLFIFG